MTKMGESRGWPMSGDPLHWPYVAMRTGERALKSLKATAGTLDNGLILITIFNLIHENEDCTESKLVERLMEPRSSVERRLAGLEGRNCVRIKRDGRIKNITLTTAAQRSLLRILFNRLNHTAELLAARMSRSG